MLGGVISGILIGFGVVWRLGGTATGIMFSGFKVAAYYFNYCSTSSAFYFAISSLYFKIGALFSYSANSGPSLFAIN